MIEAQERYWTAELSNRLSAVDMNGVRARGFRAHSILTKSKSLKSGSNSLLTHVFYPKTGSHFWETCFTHDGAGNITRDVKNGIITDYAYNKAGQLSSVKVGGSQRGSYTYNGFGQLARRVVSNVTPSGTIGSIYDLNGNLLAETDGSGNVVREYIWIEHRDSNSTDAATGTATPFAVVSGVNSNSPSIYRVMWDSRNRPILMSDMNRQAVWRAQYLPFGGVHQIEGSASLNARFPGQWYQLESGLAYNWHRHYDATLGSYTQPDPLGLVDGPNRYAYALNAPNMYTDPRGEFAWVLLGLAGGLALEATADYLEQKTCGCGSGSSGAQYAAAGAAGAALGDHAVPLRKTRSGVGGKQTSPYTNRLRRYSQRIFGNRQFSRNMWAPSLRNPHLGTRSISAFIGRWSLFAGGAYAAYDTYRIGRCLYQASR